MQYLDGAVDNTSIHTTDIIAESDRLQPRLGILLRVLHSTGDVLNGLLPVLAEPLHTLIDLLRHNLQPLVRGISRGNHPTGPRCIDFSNPLQLAIVIELLSGEVFPHEEIGRVAFVDTVSERLEVAQWHHFERRLGRLQPSVLVGEHIRHDIRPAPNPRDTDALAIQFFDVVDAAFRAGAHRPAQWTVYVCADEFVRWSLFLGVCLAQISDETFGQADRDVDGVVFQRSGHGAGAGWERLGVGFEVEVFLGKVKRCGEVLCGVSVAVVFSYQRPAYQAHIRF